jgi:hypothetical protein
VGEVKRLVDHWTNRYDWRKHEHQVNQLQQFTLPLDVEDFETLKLHFVHKKSHQLDAIPLLFVHGWPGHFSEVSKLLPLLIDPPTDKPAFHVVAPSIPGVPNCGPCPRGHLQRTVPLSGPSPPQNATSVCRSSVGQVGKGTFPN